VLDGVGLTVTDLFCIVLTKDGLTFEAFKLKSMKFLEEETKLLDKEQTNIEDEQ
jgi:hypothetical protein